MGCGTKLDAAAARPARKTVTALFCDLVGSTTLAERHDPEVLRPLLDGYFAAARESIERHGGRVEKYIGDAVCAVFGVPTAHEDDALRSVRAALEVQERLTRLRESSAVVLEARIGITTGQVLVSGGGAPLIGDAMNTASRLQSGARPGDVLIGEPTWRLVRDAVTAQPAPPLVAKGKAEPVPAWRVIAALAPHSSARARSIDVPMVGRQVESAELANAYRRVIEGGSCRRFTVLGAAGVGKSRLVDEFLRSLGDEAEVLRGRCVSYGEGITWLPVVDALKPALGLAAFAGQRDVEVAVQHAASGEGTDADLVAAGLGGLFGLPGSGSAEQTAWAVRRFLEARARVRPVVLVFDDLQWAEPAMLDLVEHVGERVDAPLFVLCMARPEVADARRAWAASDTTSDVVHLDALPRSAADTLVDALLGGSAVPAAVRERIASAAGGNPLFTEEVVRMLVDDGRLVHEDDDWAVVGDLAAIPIPPTVSALLSSRLDRLPEPERVLLEAASIEGQSFSVAALEALLPEVSHRALSERLDVLARKELVIPEERPGPGRDGYRFRHLLVRDAAYDAIPKSLRARLHLAFADWLEAAAATAITEYGEVVGHHLAETHRYREELAQPDDPGLRMRAGRAFAAAGSRAYDELGDERTAVRLLEAAIDIAPATAETAVWDERLWNIGFIVLQRPRDARPRDVQREVYGDDVGETVAARDARLRLEFADPSAIDRATGHGRDLRALELYRGQGARHLEPGVFLRLEQGAYFEGDPEATERWAREALRLAEELGWRDVIEWAAGDLLNAVSVGPSPFSVLITEADALLGRWGGRLASRPVLVSRAEALAFMGDAVAARADLDRSARLREAVGLPRDLNDLWAVPGFALAFGELDTAVQACEEALALQPEGDALNRNFMLGTYARVLLELGRDAEAAAAIDPLGTSAIVEQRVTHRSIRGRLLARATEAEAARRCIDEAAALAAPTGLAILKADVALDRAHVLLSSGDGAAAGASAEEAVQRYEAKQHRVGAWAARAVLERAVNTT